MRTNISLGFNCGSTVSKKYLDRIFLIYRVACWARKARILCRSSFFTLSGTSAAQKDQQGGKMRQTVDRKISYFLFGYEHARCKHMGSHLQFTDQKILLSKNPHLFILINSTSRSVPLPFGVTSVTMSSTVTCSRPFSLTTSGQTGDWMTSQRQFHGRADKHSQVNTIPLQSALIWSFHPHSTSFALSSSFNLRTHIELTLFHRLQITYDQIT